LIVPDASVLLELLLNTALAPGIRQRLFADNGTIHIPHLTDVDVLQVLRRYIRTRVLTPARAGLAIQDYTDMPLNRYAHQVLLERVWTLRHNFTAYDAVYLALAGALDAPLATCDRALASLSGSGAKVLLF